MGLEAAEIIEMVSEWNSIIAVGAAKKMKKKKKNCSHFMNIFVIK